jgi:hypothetical protein
MDSIFTFILSIHTIAWGTGAIILIYLIVKRIKDKKGETFENRDN